MQLIGATKGFIMKPFLIRAIISGIISAILAISIWSILLYLGYYKFSFNYTSNDLVIFGIGASCLVVFGILVSILSTYLSVNKYLRLKLDELY
jgi:cell division transport system permease protein